HEKSELGGRFGQHVGGIGEWNLVLVSVGAVDVVEADRDLRHDLKRVLLRFDRIAQRRDQRINAALYFLDDQILGRRLGALKNLELVTALAQTILRRI